MDKEKCGPISFPEMYELLLKRQAAGQPLVRNDEVWELWGYGPEVDDDRVRKRTSEFQEWLEQEHGLLWPSTGNRRLYRADVAQDYRRKPNEPSSTIKKST